MSVSTQRGRPGTLKDYFSWLTKQNAIPANPASELEMPRPERRLSKEPLGLHQVEAVIAAPDIDRAGSCHLLRHTCATHMLKGGADIRFIQQQLGHEKLETTAIYTQVGIEQLKDVHRRTHPVEKRRRENGEDKPLVTP
ncbi:tyrosine-type recombinase/integrase [Haloferula sargassicola]|uniref:Tyrosine recombinase XerC n=1 Tax=Haloferula sargassicola TaxID=490096 RepID=A0ABP9UYV4_9BACT